MDARTILPVFVALALTGCTSQAPTVPPSDAPASVQANGARAAVPRRPLSGWCETGFAAPPVPPPPVLRQVDTGLCQLSHLGRAAMHSVKDINSAAGTQVIVELTFTAANGDVVRGAGAGTNTLIGPGRVGFSATVTLSGGTGRFENLDGWIRIEGVANLTNRTATMSVVEGWVEY